MARISVLNSSNDTKSSESTSAETASTVLNSDYKISLKKKPFFYENIFIEVLNARFQFLSRFLLFISAVVAFVSNSIHYPVLFNSNATSTNFLKQQSPILNFSLYFTPNSIVLKFLLLSAQFLISFAIFKQIINYKKTFILMGKSNTFTPFFKNYFNQFYNQFLILKNFRVFLFEIFPLVYSLSLLFFLLPLISQFNLLLIPKIHQYPQINDILIYILFLIFYYSIIISSVYHFLNLNHFPILKFNQFHNKIDFGNIFSFLSLNHFKLLIYLNLFINLSASFIYYILNLKSFIYNYLIFTWLPLVININTDIPLSNSNFSIFYFFSFFNQFLKLSLISLNLSIFYLIIHNAFKIYILQIGCLHYNQPLSSIANDSKTQIDSIISGLLSNKVLIKTTAYQDLAYLSINDQSFRKNLYTNLSNITVPDNKTISFNNNDNTNTNTNKNDTNSKKNNFNNKNYKNDFKKNNFNDNKKNNNYNNNSNYKNNNYKNNNYQNNNQKNIKTIEIYSWFIILHQIESLINNSIKNINKVLVQKPKLALNINTKPSKDEIKIKGDISDKLFGNIILNSNSNNKNNLTDEDSNQKINLTPIKFKNSRIFSNVYGLLQDPDAKQSNLIISNIQNYANLIKNNYPIYLKKFLDYLLNNYKVLSFLFNSNFKNDSQIILNENSTNLGNSIIIISNLLLFSIDESSIGLNSNIVFTTIIKILDLLDNLISTTAVFKKKFSTEIKDKKEIDIISEIHDLAMLYFFKISVKYKHLINDLPLSKPVYKLAKWSINQSLKSNNEENNSISDLNMKTFDNLKSKLNLKMKDSNLSFLEHESSNQFQNQTSTSTDTSMMYDNFKQEDDVTTFDVSILY
ncbi:uncharacterized protein ASCRUDRAFT_6919 [Ascoidea rubescens DSM 1968]|uniref:Nucleoporin NDC1 n=1 Tax=Ascoidea rubescens DSM 1968 TaxID=1344418 RepID=A0A1D2VL53_9ASCO|nr:hypothetical protein ASCRUDRAFT_6919 [Ascoidea rubescens DSM 1968]ODV62321.1 hypothetical protein ASCRUDRAFT_6919 [Ascoidea rubescens DSM 1968]